MPEMGTAGGARGRAGRLVKGEEEGGCLCQGKRLKSPSGFQSECCHQHMCSRHVEGGGSINGGASLFGPPFLIPLAGNFISHNRASRPRSLPPPLSSFL